MRGEGIGQPEVRGDLCAVGARAKDPERHVQTGTRHGANLLAFLDRTEEHAQRLDVVGEMLGRLRMDPKRTHRDLIGTRGAAQAEVDTTRVERLERAELLSDDQRRVIGQHDAARAHANRLCAAGQIADHHRGGRACDAGHVVMLGDPIAAIAPVFGMPDEIERIAQGIGGCVTESDRHQVEDGNRDHVRESRVVWFLNQV